MGFVLGQEEGSKEFIQNFYCERLGKLFSVIFMLSSHF